MGIVDISCIKKDSRSGGHSRLKLYQERFQKMVGIVEKEFRKW
jgi:hypothetical protein